MSADPSAYAILGLEPGADWSSVERAYKALIKVYHPDRPGGDADRAAEINRAYRELRRLRAPEQVSELFMSPEPVEPPRRRRGRWLAATLVLIAGGVGVAVLTNPSTRLFDDFVPPSAPLLSRTPPVTAAAPEPTTEPMTAPLTPGAIESAIARAQRVAASRNEQAMSDASDACRGEFAARPTLARLDGCAAFDDAIVEIENRDPWHDNGPFSAIAVSGRQMSGASLLSNDYLAIEGRLDRIRLAVEAALSPPAPAPPPPAPEPEPAPDQQVPAKQVD